MRFRFGTWGLAIAATALTAGVAQGQDRTRRTIYEETFEVSSGGSLFVDLGDMDIRVVTGGTAGHVEVIAWARDHDFAREVFDWMRFSAGTSGRALRVETDEPNERPWGWQEWDRRGGVGFEAIITVPAAFDLDLHSGDGDVAVDEIRGSVAIRTGDGDVSIDGATGPEIFLQSGDGDLVAGRLDAEKITLRTGDGDVRIDEASGAITASSGDGDVSIGVGRYAGLSIQTGDGDVTVSADPSIHASLDIDAEELDMARAFSLAGGVRGGRLRATLNGGGAELRIRTGDGSVELRAR